MGESAVRSFNKLFVPVFFYQTLNYVWMSDNVAWWPSDATLTNAPLALGTAAPPPNLCCSARVFSLTGVVLRSGAVRGVRLLLLVLPPGAPPPLDLQVHPQTPPPADCPYQRSVAILRKFPSPHFSGLDGKWLEAPKRLRQCVRVGAGIEDAINEHPVEYLIGEYFHLLAIAIVSNTLRLHIASIIGFFLAAAILPALNHTRQDIVIPGFYRSMHHDQHHVMPNCNYGNYCMFWDKLMGTFVPHPSLRQKRVD